MTEQSQDHLKRMNEKSINRIVNLLSVNSIILNSYAR